MAGIADREGVVAGFGRLVVLRVLGAGPDLFLELMANFSSGGTEGERMSCGKIFQCRILGTVCYQSERMPIAHAYLRLCRHLVRSHCEVAALR